MRLCLLLLCAYAVVVHGYNAHTQSHALYRRRTSVRSRLLAKRAAEPDPFLSNRALAPVPAPPAGTTTTDTASATPRPGRLSARRAKPTDVLHSGIPLVTSAIGVGTVTSSPALYETKTGLSVCNVRLACKQALSDDFNGISASGADDLVSIVAEFWGRDADHIASSVDVGSRIAVSGSLYMSKWVDKTTGKERSAMKLRCKAFEIIAGPTITKRSTAGNTLKTTSAAQTRASTGSDDSGEGRSDADEFAIDYSGRDG